MLVIRMTLLRGATRQLCAAAQTRLRDRHGTLLDCGDELKIIAALLSRLVGNQGRDEEAMKFVHSAKRAAADDVESQALWRDADRCAGWRYQLAEELARTAVARVRETEAPYMQADTPSRDVEGVLA